MGIVVDIIIILLVLLCIYKGYKEGLIGMAFSIATFFLAGILALVLMTPVSELIVSNTEFDEKIESAIISQFETPKEETQEQSSETMPDVITNYIDEYTTSIKNATVETAAINVSVLIIKIIVFIVLYIVIKLVLRLLKSIINLVGKLPIIKQFNKLGGILAGGIKGILIVYVVLGIMLLLATLFGTLQIYGYIHQSTIGSLMYSNNILVNFIFNLI